MQLPGINAMALVFESLLKQASQRQIHIIAAQQNVIADRYSLERQLAILYGDRNQAEVSSAAANIAYQNQAADFDLLSPSFALAFDPCVKCRLRLFKQRNVL